MRRDMSRLIIEDGRRGRGGPKTMYDKITRRGEEFENLPSHESMSRHRKMHGNSSGDRLLPLRRYLASQVGRPWNKVYSEICAVNDRRGIRGFHLLSHLKDYVQIKPDPAAAADGRRSWHWTPFYVDRHGLLKTEKRPGWRWRAAADPRAPKQETVKIPLGANEWYEKLEGLWYRFTQHAITYRLPDRYVSRGSKTVLIHIDREVTENVTTKRQCGKKELRAIASLLAQN